MLFVAGVSHKTAPLAVRERLAVAPERVPELLDQLLENDQVSEAVLVATCNRTELYAACDPHAQPLIAGWLGRLGDIDGTLEEHQYLYRDEAAARHLFRVTAGLDSMVLGETQILGQVKNAYLTAHHGAAVGPELHQLFQHAFGAAKTLRGSPGLDSVRSLPYAAAKLARERLGKLDGATAVVVGAGETIETLAFHLRSQGIGRLVVANRSPDAAEALAARHGGETHPLPQLAGVLGEADVVASATSSPVPLITPDMLAARDPRRPLLLLDLAVPRDVAPGVSDVQGAEVVTVDDLAAVVAASEEMRFAAAAEAEREVEKELGVWRKARRIRTAAPTICEVRAEAAHTRRRTLAEARRIAGSRGTDAALEYLATTLTNRLMHSPTVRLREAAAGGDAQLLAAARELFGLDDDSGDQADIEAA